MQRGLLLLLAVALCGWFAPNAGALTRTSEATASQYDEVVAVVVVVLGDGITMDIFEGSQKDPLSLHKYLYCLADPTDLTDPSGTYSTYRQYYGYAVEDAIQDFYEEDHPGPKPILKSKRVFRKDTPTRWLFPDIFDPNRNVWLEVKPLSISGLASGEAKRVLNLKALPGWPELVWQPPLLTQIATGETFVSVNVAGVVYYQREDLVEKELLTMIASGVAYSAKDLLKYVSSQAGRAVIQGSWRPVISYSSSLISGGKTADNSRGQIMTAIAGLDSLFLGF